MNSRARLAFSYLQVVRPKELPLLSGVQHALDNCCRTLHPEAAIIHDLAIERDQQLTFSAACSL